MLSLAVPALAAAPASVSGVVQDSNHAPLMGVVVELFGSVEAFPLLTAFTDIHGHYQFANLAPGRYSIRVLQAYSLPAHRKNIRVDTGTHADRQSEFDVVDGCIAMVPGRSTCRG